MAKTAITARQVEQALFALADHYNAVAARDKDAPIWAENCERWARAAGDLAESDIMLRTIADLLNGKAL